MSTVMSAGSFGTIWSGLAVGAALNHLPEGGALGEGPTGILGSYCLDEERSVRSRAPPFGEGIQRSN